MVKGFVGRSNSKSIATIKKAEKYFKNRDKALLSFDLNDDFNKGYHDVDFELKWRIENAICI